MYGKILVPLDDSHRSDKILPHVEELAKRYGSKVIFLRVVRYHRGRGSGYRRRRFQGRSVFSVRFLHFI
jgi:nucleotide-binding universal stress UspA family protein